MMIYYRMIRFSVKDMIDCKMGNERTIEGRRKSISHTVDLI